MKKALISISVLFLLFLSAASYFLYDVFRYVEMPAGEEDRTLSVSLLPGQNLEILTDMLTEKGLIRRPLFFRWFARFKRYDKKLKAGEYALSPRMSPHDMLTAIVNGKVRLYRMTIPEGYTMVQIAEKAAREGFGSAADFMAAAKDPLLLARMDIGGDTFEGYLFPDTYQFPRGTTAPELIDAMVKRFWEIYTPAWQKRTAEMGFSVHQMVTLASIIEKETGEASERPVISSVFHNRLNKNMRLESDPTVIYGIEDFAGNITRAHLDTPTPYNTYTRRGLPPGPIANPGKAALEAALYPAETEFFYFVAKGDGAHVFSTTIRDHNRAVRTYQLKRK